MPSALEQEVIDDYKAEGSDYLALAKKYSDQLKEIKGDKQLGDMVLDKDSPYEVTQRKLQVLNSLYKNGELPKPEVNKEKGSVKPEKSLEPPSKEEVFTRDEELNPPPTNPPVTNSKPRVK